MIILGLWLFIVLAVAVWPGQAEASLEEALAIYERAEDTDRMYGTEAFRPQTSAFSAPRAIPRRPAGVSLQQRQLRALAIREAVTHRVPPDLFLAIIEVESRFDQAALGKAKEIGLVQILPATYETLRAQGLVYGDPWHPRTNLHSGAVYLRQIIEGLSKGDLLAAYQRLGLTPYEAAASAYNAGPEAVRSAIAGRRLLPASTRIYAEQVRALSKSERMTIKATSKR